MEFLNEMLDLNDYDVIDINVKENGIHVYLESKKEHSVCPKCGQKTHKIHEHNSRMVRDLPITGKACYLHFDKRRFYCEHCDGPFSEEIEFVDPRSNFTGRYREYLYELSRHYTIKHTADFENLDYSCVENVFYSECRKRIPENPFEDLTQLGIDEISERKGRNSYDLVFYNLQTGKPVEVLEKRTKSELIRYFEDLTDEIKIDIQTVCIDMWRPYADAVEQCLPHADLVVDRFHVMKAINKELNQLKNKHKKDLSEEAKGCHYPLLKNEEDLTDNQQEVLEKVYEESEILKKAHQLKEAFRDIFEKEQTINQAKNQLENWLEQAGQIFKDSVKTIKNWLAPILNYFNDRISNGVSEGVNNKIKLIKRMAYGFRNFEHFRLRILNAF